MAWTFFPYFLYTRDYLLLYNNNSKAVSKKFKHAFWLMMKYKEMRKENVLLWPLFCAYLFCFPFCRKTHAWIPRKYDVLSNCFKIQQLQLSLEEKSTFFAAPEVKTEFSAAWCLSIVSQGANFASLRNVEGSAGAVVYCSGRESDKNRRTALVLAFCTLQSAFLSTNGAIHSTIWIHWVKLTWSRPRVPRILWF